MSQIEWITSYSDGLATAKEQNRLVFLDFFNPN
jgi:hypothetical protein